MATNPSSQPFPYEPLKRGQIRLLRLSEKGGESILQLSPFYLASAPNYYALSYTWGSLDADRRTVNINGATLEVTMNLDGLLPYLFKRYKNQYFWIDAICINQGDKEEKEDQIPRMGKIYTQTKAGVIWLGHSNERIDQAIPKIPELARKFQGYDLRLGVDERHYAARGIPAPSSPIWQGLKELVSLEWFTRVWTFQEAVLRGEIEVLCGRHLIPTTSVAQLAYFSNFFPESGSLKTMIDPVDATARKAHNGIERITTISYARYYRSHPEATRYTFLDLLGKSFEWKCEKHLDKFYGLRGLADEDVQEVLKVDYKMSFAELMLDFGKYWITRDSQFQLFHHIASHRLASDRPRKHPAYGLPSWLPSFFEPQIATSFWPSAHPARYSAGVRTGEPTRLQVISDRVIGVEGFRVDRIAKALKCPWERQKYTDAESRARGMAESTIWHEECLALARSLYGRSSGPAYEPPQANSLLNAAKDIYRAFSKNTAGVDEDDIPDAFWRTLIANKHAKGEYFSGDGRELYHLLKIEAHKICGTMNLLSPTELALAKKPITTKKYIQLQDVAEANGYAVHGRSFFTTERGRIGIGPQHTKPGDLVCIFFNGFTPFIIRPTQQERYVLIGESYVHGLMYGEALNGGDMVTDQFFMLE